MIEFVECRAMKKAKIIEEEKRKHIGIVETSVKELEEQKAVLINMIESRLKEYVQQKNCLTEIANREIEEFNVMYEEFEAICHNLNVSIEDVLTEGASES